MSAPAPKRKKVSGASSDEALRTDKVVSVRISDEAREALDRVAERWGLSRSAAVARLALEADAREEA